jgi:hypothetical protein
MIEPTGKACPYEKMMVESEKEGCIQSCALFDFDYGTCSLTATARRLRKILMYMERSGDFDVCYGGDEDG